MFNMAALGRLRLTNPPVMHFDKTIATPGKHAVVCGHNERDTFLGDQIEEQLKEHLEPMLARARSGAIGSSDPPARARNSAAPR